MTYLNNLTWNQARHYALGLGGGARRRIRRAKWAVKVPLSAGYVWLVRRKFLWHLDYNDLANVRVVTATDFGVEEFWANDWIVELPDGQLPPIPPDDDPFRPPIIDPVLPCGECVPDTIGGGTGDPHFALMDESFRAVAFWDDNLVSAEGVKTLFFRSGDIEVWYATKPGGPPGGMVIKKVWVTDPRMEEGGGALVFDISAQQPPGGFDFVVPTPVKIASGVTTPLTSTWSRTASIPTGGAYLVSVTPDMRGGGYFNFTCDLVPESRCQVRAIGGGLSWAYRRIALERQAIIGPNGVGSGAGVDGWRWLGAPFGLTRAHLASPVTSPDTVVDARFWATICPVQRVPIRVGWDPLAWTDWTPSTDDYCQSESVAQTRTNLLSGEVQTRETAGTAECCAWRIIEAGYGVIYLSGGSGTKPPPTWTPPTYGYEGFMELQYDCGDGWQTAKQWVTRNGGPTVNLP